MNLQPGGGDGVCAQQVCRWNQIVGSSWYAQGQGYHSHGSKLAAGMDNWDLLKFIKDKCQVLCLGKKSPLQFIQAGEQLYRKDPGVLADRELLKSC